MMTSSIGNISRVTGHLCGEFTGPGEFPAQRPVTRSFDVFFDLCLNKRLSKQSRSWWFETQSRPLWRHCNALCLRRHRVGIVIQLCRFNIISFFIGIWQRHLTQLITFIFHETVRPEKYKRDFEDLTYNLKIPGRLIVENMCSAVLVCKT